MTAGVNFSRGNGLIVALSTRNDKIFFNLILISVNEFFYLWEGMRHWLLLLPITQLLLRLTNFITVTDNKQTCLMEALLCLSSDVLLWSSLDRKSAQ